MAPTVFGFEGLRFVIYPNDHRPAHVHVMGRGCEAVISRREIRHTVAVLLDHLADLCRAWERIHGVA